MFLRVYQTSEASEHREKGVAIPEKMWYHI